MKFNNQDLYIPSLMAVDVDAPGSPGKGKNVLVVFDNVA
jgi:hypothetical protein